MFIQVAVERKSSKMQDLLSYMVPTSLQTSIALGSRVTVPFGHQRLQGYVVGFALPPAHIHCKEISGILDEVPVLNEELVHLALWASQYYLCSCYTILEYMLPKFVRQRRQQQIHWCGNDELAQRYLLFADSKWQSLLHELEHHDKSLDWLVKRYGQQITVLLTEWQSQGLIEIIEGFAQQGGKREEFIYESLLTPEQFQSEEIQQKLKKAVKQMELLRYLTYEGPQRGPRLRNYWPNYISLVRQLLEKNLIQKTKMDQKRYLLQENFFQNGEHLRLNQEQQQAQEIIDQFLLSERQETVLLHGITGSGKTEVYLRALQKNLSLNRGAIVLVPEIALTPQLIGRFKGILGDTVEVLHSGLSDGERLDVWENLRNGTLKIVVGVRSAIFAPVQNLGLIIMDEEHETTYKQNEPEPRYHAREVALERARQNQALLILGSATPSVDSYYHAIHGRYHLLELHHRAQQQPLPVVEVVNMSREFQRGNRSMFSSLLVDTMESSLKKGEQVILFMNRRGFASAVVCRECGHTLTCEKCSISLTYHKEKHLVKCHYCDYLSPMPSCCPNCGSQFIRYMGSGTELVTEELHNIWPWINVLRMDLDSTQRKGSHQEILKQFAQGEAQVLVGTQMVAKGLNFPNVTTVGVLAADFILNLPDYAASERTFQLLTQVAGRAGRGAKEGHVIVQTYNPSHYSIVMGQQHNYKGFYDKEIKNRQLMRYPPFVYLIRVLVSDLEETILPLYLQALAAAIIEYNPQIDLLGPAEAPIAVIRRRHRWHLILKHPDLDVLREAVKYGQKVTNLSRKSKTLRILIDVEPQSVL